MFTGKSHLLTQKFSIHLLQLVFTTIRALKLKILRSGYLSLANYSVQRLGPHMRFLGSQNSFIGSSYEAPGKQRVKTNQVSNFGSFVTAVKVISKQAGYYGSWCAEARPRLRYMI